MSMLMRRGGQHWIPSIFNDFFNSDILVRNSSTAPAINVFETEKEYKVEVAAAGMRKEDFKIHIDSENDLTITMEKNCNCTKDDTSCCDTGKETGKEEDKCDCKGRYLRREFSYSKFQQTLVLPDDADTAKIDAKVCDGVLHIEIPKKAQSKENKVNRVIEIQ